MNDAIIRAAPMSHWTFERHLDKFPSIPGLLHAAGLERLTGASVTGRECVAELCAVNQSIALSGDAQEVQVSFGPHCQKHQRVR